MRANIGTTTGSLYYCELARQLADVLLHDNQQPSAEVGWNRIATATATEYTSKHPLHQNVNDSSIVSNARIDFPIKLCTRRVISSTLWYFVLCVHICQFCCKKSTVFR